MLQKCQDACDEFQTHREDTGGIPKEETSGTADVNPMWFRPVLNKLKDVTERYQNLVSCCNSLLDHETDACRIDAKFAELADALANWLDTEMAALDELKLDRSPDVERRLEMVRAFVSEAVLSGEQRYDRVKQASVELCNCLKELGASEKALDEVTDRVAALRSRLFELINSAGDFTDQLEIERLKAEPGGDRESVRHLAAWIRDVEHQLAGFGVASLHEDEVRSQLHQLHVIQLDIESHSAAIHLAASSMREMMKSLTNASEAEELGDQVDEMVSGYGRLQDRCSRQVNAD